MIFNIFNGESVNLSEQEASAPDNTGLSTTLPQKQEWFSEFHGYDWTHWLFVGDHSIRSISRVRTAIKFSKTEIIFAFICSKPKV